MTAPTRELLRAGTKHFDEIDAIDTAAGAFRHVAFVAENDARSIVFSRDATGHDPDDARVPILREEHDARMRRVLGFDQPLRFLRDRTLDLLPLAVEDVELARRVDAER